MVAGWKVISATRRQINNLEGMTIMKYLSLLFVAAVVLTGCAHEAYYADNEYGIASMDAYDRHPPPFATSRIVTPAYYGAAAS